MLLEDSGFGVRDPSKKLSGLKLGSSRVLGFRFYCVGFRGLGVWVYGVVPENISRDSPANPKSTPRPNAMSCLNRLVKGAG